MNGKTNSHQSSLTSMQQDGLLKHVFLVLPFDQLELQHNLTIIILHGVVYLLKCLHLIVEQVLISLPTQSISRIVDLENLLTSTVAVHSGLIVLLVISRSPYNICHYAKPVIDLSKMELPIYYRCHCYQRNTMFSLILALKMLSLCLTRIASIQ